MRRKSGRKHAQSGRQRGNTCREGRLYPGPRKPGEARKGLPLEGTWWPTELSEKRLKRVHSQSVGFDCAIQSVGFDCDSPGSEQGLEIKMVQWLDTLCSSEDLSLVPSPHLAGAQPPAPPVLGDLTPSFGLNSTHIYLANTLPHTCT